MYFSCAPTLFLAALLFCSATPLEQSPSPQAQSPARPKSPSRHSVEVVAHLSPEEAEEGRLNDLYEAVAQRQRKGVCTPEIIQRYQSEVIPLVEKSAFNVPKNKFLFLVNRDIGNCYMAQQRHEEAEERFKQIMEYLPVWPGTDDSAYPINFRQIATAQMGQQHWEAAEESLNKSVASFDLQIERARNSDSEFSRTEHAGNLLGGKARSLSYLAIVYLREGRTTEALKSVELAYKEAARPDVQAAAVNEVLKVGSSIAQQSGDESAITRWSQRSPRQN